MNVNETALNAHVDNMVEVGIEQERARWVAAVEEIRRLAEKDATPYEPVHPSKYFDQFARMLLTRMEVES